MTEKTIDHLGRDEKDFAIEHAGYLANTVERLLQADRSILDAEEWLDLNTRVYEFRKRAARAKTQSNQSNQQGIEIPAWVGMLLIVSVPVIFWSVVGYSGYRLIRKVRFRRYRIANIPNLPKTINELIQILKTSTKGNRWLDRAISDFVPGQTFEERLYENRPPPAYTTSLDVQLAHVPDALVTHITRLREKIPS